MSNEYMNVYELVELLKREGRRLAPVVPVEGMPSMVFDFKFSSDGVSADELDVVMSGCPEGLRLFWGIARSARLFEDQVYGQWGLEIFDPQQVVGMTSGYREERWCDFVKGDVVVGRFIGDADLLMIRCDPMADDYGFVFVILPLDHRSEWPRAAQSFSCFLNDYVKSGGGKFWTGGAAK